MQRAVFVLLGVLVLSLAAFGLAEVTMVSDHRFPLTDDRSVRPSTGSKTAVTPSPSPSATPAPTLVPDPTPAPTPVASTAITVSFVHMRAGASTSTPILTDLNGGTVVTLGAYADNQWQQVFYNGQSGYVFKAYLRY